MVRGRISSRDCLVSEPSTLLLALLSLTKQGTKTLNLAVSPTKTRQKKFTLLSLFLGLTCLRRKSRLVSEKYLSFYFLALILLVLSLTLFETEKKVVEELAFQ